MTTANRPIQLRWYCIKHACEHDDIMPLEEATEAARTLFADGSPYVLLTDLARHTMLMQDGTEAALRTPISLGESLQAAEVAVEADGLLKRVFKPDKSL